MRMGIHFTTATPVAFANSRSVLSCFALNNSQRIHEVFERRVFRAKIVELVADVIHLLGLACRRSPDSSRTPQPPLP